MQTGYAIFLSLAISHLLLLGLYILLFHRRSPLGVLAGCLVVTLLSGLAGEALNTVVNSDDPTLLIYVTMILNRIGNLSMPLTWLIALKLFDDNFSFRKINNGLWILIGAALVARSIGSYFAHYQVDVGVATLVFTWGFSQAVLLGFSLASIYVAIRGFISDLVIERRQERVIFVICVSVLLLLMAGNRGVWVVDAVSRGTIFTPTPLPSSLYSIYAYLVTSALFLWKYHDANLWKVQRQAQKLQEDGSGERTDQEKALADHIRRAMEEDKLYREANLTVAGLAEFVDSQEYLVRRAINNHMGFRNFSDFLNHYRIAETTSLLAETDRPVSAIGFDVGYSSLSSFYKAFKNRQTVTPKQYRLQRKVES